MSGNWKLTAPVGKVGLDYTEDGVFNILSTRIISNWKN